MARGRYRKVSLRITSDARFRRLSAPQPCGQYLFLYLLIGPHTGPIPGLSSAGEAGLAEALGWPLKGFREAFREASLEGLVEADWEARLVWVPKAIRHNPPESPNVIRSWDGPWDELPECELKRHAWRQLKGFMEGLSEGYRKAFAEALPEDYGESGTGTGTGTGTGVRVRTPASADADDGVGVSKKRQSKPRASREAGTVGGFQDWAHGEWELRYGAPPTWGKKDFVALATVWRKLGADPEARRRWLAYLADTQDFVKGHPPAKWQSQVDRYAERAGNGGNMAPSAAGERLRRRVVGGGP